MRVIHLWNSNKNTYLAKESTDCIKGFFALVVVLAHIRGQLPVFNNTMVGQLLTAAGYLSVAIFFFISGYGIEASYKTKGDKYVVNFHKNRIIPFYFSYLLVLVIYLLFYMLLGKMGEVNGALIVRSIFLQGTIVQNGWYIETIILFYIVFWVGYCNVKKKNRRILIVFLGVVLYCAWCIVDKRGPYSYVSVFAFPLGIIWCECQTKLDRIFAKKKNEILGVLIVFATFCVTLIGGNIPIFTKPIMLTLRCFSSIVFVVLVLLVSRILRINNFILRFLGKISCEIYVFHGLFLVLYKEVFNIEKAGMYILVVMVSSISFAYLLHPVMGGLNVLIKKMLIK